MMTFWMIYFMCGVSMYVYLAIQAQSRKMGMGLSMFDLPEFQYAAIMSALLWPLALVAIFGRY